MKKVFSGHAEKNGGVVVSKHASKRIRQRMRLGPKSAGKMARRAYVCGLSESDFSGRLQKYFASQFREEGIEARIYGHFFYIFAGETLVTVFQVPQEFNRAVDRALGELQHSSENAVA